MTDVRLNTPAPFDRHRTVQKNSEGRASKAITLQIVR